MALLYAMNVIDGPFLPPYASAILIDLYQARDGSHFVELTYKNDTPAVKGCINGKSTITVRRLLRLLATVLAVSECKKADSGDSSDEDARSEAMIRYTVPGCPSAKCPVDTFIASLESRSSFPLSKRNADCGIKEPARKALRNSVIRDRL